MPFPIPPLGPNAPARIRAIDAEARHVCAQGDAFEARCQQGEQLTDAEIGEWYALAARLVGLAVQLRMATELWRRGYDA